MKISLPLFGLLVVGLFLLLACSREGTVTSLSEEPKESSSSVSSSSISSSSFVINSGTFTDTRDSKTYKWTEIGDQIWMAENLNFGTRVDGSENQKDAIAADAEKYCYSNDESNCDIYGGLYQWHSVMALPFSCDTIFGCTVNTPHRGICPEGWHVPTQEEWATLYVWVDSDNDGRINNDPGSSLKSTIGWGVGNGTDAYGWTALSGGGRHGGNFFDQDGYGYWWSASESNANDAWLRSLSLVSAILVENLIYKGNYGFSVRCVKD